MGYEYILKQNTGDSHQVTAWAGITFLSYAYKDTSHNFNRSINNPDLMTVNNITVTSDILRVSVNNTKANYLDTAEATLASGSLNYQSIIFPGDHAIIWINNGLTDENSVMNQAGKSQQANGFSSGLKFIGKVNSVRSVYATLPNGIKTLRYHVTFKAFSEFADCIYYNQSLAPNNTSNVPTNPLVFEALSAKWRTFIEKTDGLTDVQDLIDFCITVFLGPGPSKKDVFTTGEESLSPNRSFRIPNELASILGTTVNSNSKPLEYADILHTIFGIQTFNNNYSSLPDITTNRGTAARLFTKTPLSGNVLAPSDMFNNVPLWSILQQSLNSCINELYTTLRVNQNNQIMPTLIARQIPFTSIYFDNFLKRDGLNSNSVSHTKFVDVPRWIIDPSITVNEFNIGTSDATRFNFFQVFAALLNLKGANPGIDQSLQFEHLNFFIDNLDMIRNGNRPMVRTSTAVLDAAGSGFYKIREWAYIMADAFIDGHLKLSGSVTCSGITEPICVGDNLEIADKLLHIESLSHTYEVSETEGGGAYKTFYTNLNLSQGVLSNGDYIIYEGSQLPESELAPRFSVEKSGGNDSASSNTLTTLNQQTDGKRIT